MKTENRNQHLQYFLKPALKKDVIARRETEGVGESPNSEASQPGHAEQFPLTWDIPACIGRITSSQRRQLFRGLKSGHSP